MRSRPLAAILLGLAFPVAACQLVWSYDDFKDRPGTGGRGGSGGAPASTTSSISSTASSTGGGATSSSSSSSGGPCVDGGPVGKACVDDCDQAAILAHQFSIEPDVKQCTTALAGAANPQCIAKADGLSAACAGCWADLGHCGFVNCFFLGPCSGDVNSADCSACLTKNCDCAFEACSGTGRPGAVDAGADASCK